ncbi:WxL domain-containing protein [Carnobacterium divergens]|uniref:WxL domain-containing protein n=1 Tax=Carnobacterium divergens TaxID=2748 RepID=UPI0039C9A9A8
MKLTKLAVVGLMATTVLGSTVPALAAEVGTPATSKGAVNFQEGGGETTPTDPGDNGSGEDGGTVVKPDPANPGGAGFLRIDQAPNLDFGKCQLQVKLLSTQLKT